MKTIWSLSLLLTLVALTGCNTVSNSMRISENDSPWNPIAAISEKRKSKSDDVVQPETMAAIWKDTMMSVPGKPKMKGFGGRIFFYDAENNAVPADGELVVYGFDGEADDDTRPDKKFVFKQDKFQEHFSESALGGSYSVWIPWEEVGSFRKSVTLIPIFKTADNRIIKTGQSINVLPGRERDAVDNADDLMPYRYLGSSAAVIGHNDSKASKKTSGVRKASYAESSSDEGEPVYNQTKIRVSSIPLTRNLQQMVSAAAAQPTANPASSITKPMAAAPSSQTTQPIAVPTPALPAAGANDVGEAANSKAWAPSPTPPTSRPNRASSTVYGAPGPLGQ